MKYLMFLFFSLFICFLIFIEPITYYFWSVVLLGARHPIEVIVVCSIILLVLSLVVGKKPTNMDKTHPQNPYRDWDSPLAIYKVLPFFETILSYTKYPSWITHHTLNLSLGLKCGGFIFFKINEK